MFDYAERIRRFQENLAGEADLAFLPISADLHYLAGIQRDTPNYGAVLHPGAWLEGIWLTPNATPVFALSRMTAEYEFAKSGSKSSFETRVLGDWDDPADARARHLEWFRPACEAARRPERQVGRAYSRGITGFIAGCALPFGDGYPAPTACHQERGGNRDVAASRCPDRNGFPRNAFSAAPWDA